jgi:hypothetical protein
LPDDTSGNFAESDAAAVKRLTSQGKLVFRSIKVRQGKMIVLEGGDMALAVMETVLETNGAGDLPPSMLRGRSGTRSRRLT